MLSHVNRGYEFGDALSIAASESGIEAYQGLLSSLRGRGSEPEVGRLDGTRTGE
jgi:hypothetical protein